MKKYLKKLKNNWRFAVSSVFILLMFTMPAARSILAKFMPVSVEAGGKKNDKPKQNPPSASTATFGSVSSPSSKETASPMQNSRSTRTSGGNNRPPHK